MNLGFAFDSFIYRFQPFFQGGFQFIETRAGSIRIFDSGAGKKQTVVLTPDGPCTIEHFSELIGKLETMFRVVVFDMPGFGLSRPGRNYDHSPDRAVECIEDIFNWLDIEKAILNFTCVNGFYALAFAKKFPERVTGVILGQTPDMPAMLDWVDRIIPKALRIPLMGQIINWFGRYRLARIWFKIALPKSHDHKPWVEKSIASLDSGGCNCLASVVQGMTKSNNAQFEGVAAPVILHWGASDRSHPDSPAQSLENITKAHIEILPDCGHFPNLENPDLVLRAAKMLVE